MKVRPITDGEGDGVRTLRLRALRDAPSAFFSTAEAEERWTDDEWRRWLGQGTPFVAEDADGTWCGLAVAGLPDGSGAARLISLWVAPERRGRGVGRRLVDAVVDWAWSHGFQTLELWVERTNVPARRTYEGVGFRPTGKVWTRTRDGVVEDQMALTRTTG